ncbi:DUF1810 domain-containing protein [Sphingomonas sp. HF-S4]|uniref:DUF1810 domain-containing protein n=1 Tax=Sphingomonas agrestis TaxID=3080540 RepID=A0ABU3Y3M2_9SPHN|nr:DUF1810 domain-containing protein [Sphingomonas sp. HF-S4]MDV3455991.1 DUF1810 domain-containing protein [Sphingomonas sp. HF-S4]
MRANFDLERFVAAQAPVYAAALAELRAGHKRTHWMWFVFPQLAGLGASPTAQAYAIHSREEAEAHLRHPVLGPRLCEAAAAALTSGRSRAEIFGSPDDLKFRSSITLFEAVAPSEAIFREVLDRLCDGVRDPRTISGLARLWGV